MRRSTVILLIICLLLGVLVWYMQQPGNPIKMALATGTATPSSSGILIDPNKGPIGLISIQDANGKTVKIDKTSGKWIVTTNRDELADQDLAESAAGQALSLTIVKQFDTAPDPAGTGLDKPVYTITVKLADGSMFLFNLGKVTVTESGYYVSTQNGTVYILSKNDVDTFVHNFIEPPVLKTATPPPTPGTETPAP